MKRLLFILALLTWAVQSFAAAGDITAARICGADLLGDSRINGWVLELDIAGVSTGGTYSMGITQGNNWAPAYSNVSLSVTSSGYDATGSLGTIVRPLYGTFPVRKPYNSQGTYDEQGAAGTNCASGVVPALTTSIRIALDGEPSGIIYSADASVTVSVAAGVYTQGGVPNNATTGLTVTNNSTLAYAMSRAICNWTMVPLQRITSTSLTVGVFCAQIGARNGKPVAAVKVTAKDAHSHTAPVVTVTALTKDTLQAAVAGAGTIQSYQATLDLSTFTDGDVVTVDFAAYPWIGGSTAVMDTSDAVNSQPTPLYATVKYYLDIAGRTSAAAVDPASGNDGTCSAVAEPFNFSSPPTSCATISKAFSLIAARNNSSYSKNDSCGTVYVKAGTAQWTGGTFALSATAGRCWVRVTPYQGVAKASVVIDRNPDTGDAYAGGTPIELDGVTVTLTGGATFTFDSMTYLWMSNTTISGGASMTAPLYRGSSFYLTGSSGGFGGNGGGHGAGLPFGNTSPDLVLARGNDFNNCTTSGGGLCAILYTFLGNTDSYANTGTAANTMQFDTKAGLSPRTASIQPLIAFNLMYHQVINGSVFGFFGQTSETGAIGAGFIQNLVENNFTDSSAAKVSIAADGTTNTPVNNVMLWHNTLVGGRINRAYNDENGATIRVRQGWQEIGNIYDQEAIKSDTFNAPPNAGRVGNWMELYGTSRYGMYSVEPTGFTIASGQFKQECFDGLDSKVPAITCGSTNPPTSGVQAVNVVKYNTRAAYDGSVAGSGGGDYTLQNTSPALGLITAGHAVLAFDIAGNARNNAGGSAGAYEGNPVGSYASTSASTLSGVGP